MISLLSKLKINIILPFVSLLCCIVVNCQEQCQTYAGGYVYPQELRPASGHKIQWSKALSKSFPSIVRYF